MQYKSLVILACLQMFTSAACSMNAGRTSGSGENAAASPDTTSYYASDADQPGIADTLRQFRQAADAAISIILQHADSAQHQELLRLCNMSEAEWIAHVGADFENERLVLSQQLNDLRFISNELIKRAAYANSVGDVASAKKYIRAAKRLGAANRGPGVPLICDLGGKAIEDLVDRNFPKMPD